jgi:hypothetical protein
LNGKEAVVNLDRNELLLLSRGGRVPRASRAKPLPVPPQRAGPGRVAKLIQRLWARSRRRSRLGLQTYLELEFTVEDER